MRSQRINPSQFQIKIKVRVAKRSMIFQYKIIVQLFDKRLNLMMYVHVPILNIAALARIFTHFQVTLIVQTIRRQSIVIIIDMFIHQI